MRVPLVDICSGPRCRFFTTPQVQYGIPGDIVYFYDKTEVRKHIYSRKRRKWAFFKQLEILEVDRVYYHIVAYASKRPSNHNNFCSAFQQPIASFFVPIVHDIDIWSSAEKPPFGNWATFEPHDKLKEFIDQNKLPEWNIIPKCPSFLDYPSRGN